MVNILVQWYVILFCLNSMTNTFKILKYNMNIHILCSLILFKNGSLYTPIVFNTIN